MAQITIIAAVAENLVIGRDGAMPWRLPTDLKAFKAATLGKPVIMGRKTLEAIGRPLPGRENIVVTGRDGVGFADVVVMSSVDAALEHGRKRAAALGVDEVMVAGGGEIYAQCLARADKLLITRVMAEPDGDAFFPEIATRDWRLAEDAAMAAGPGDSAPMRRQVYLRR